jgi:hypothetical protein
MSYYSYSTFNDDYCYSCGRRPCQCYERSCYVERSRVAPAPSLERRIELQSQELARLQDRKEKADRFGPKEQYEDDDAILFKRRFHTNSGYYKKKVYTYVAVKTPNGWYITGTNSNSMTFEALVEDHLIEADEVWVCKEWGQIT